MSRKYFRRPRREHDVSGWIGWITNQLTFRKKYLLRNFSDISKRILYLSLDSYHSHTSNFYRRLDSNHLPLPSYSPLKASITMNFHRILFLFLSSTNVSIAFMPVANTHQLHRTHQQIDRQLSPLSSLSSTPESAVEGESEATEPVVGIAPTEPGSHEELMYALGVNLARQLGDIKPLVNSGEELTFVAKGLLDAVIGRLSEEGQIILLQQRTADLNNLITERA